MYANELQLREENLKSILILMVKPMGLNDICKTTPTQKFILEREENIKKNVSQDSTYIYWCFFHAIMWLFMIFYSFIFSHTLYIVCKWFWFFFVFCLFKLQKAITLTVKKIPITQMNCIIYKSLFLCWQRSKETARLNSCRHNTTIKQLNYKCEPYSPC